MQELLSVIAVIAFCALCRVYVWLQMCSYARHDSKDESVLVIKKRNTACSEYDISETRSSDVPYLVKESTGWQMSSTWLS